MTAAGIICEYNPFLLGHARQLSLIRHTLGTETPVVCVMSGNYVQRGEPAMWDKFTRAQAAVACGADLVLELPITCVLQSAEGFAAGGVEILTKCGVVSHLSFGAECGDGEALMTLAERSLSDICEADLRRYLTPRPASRPLQTRMACYRSPTTFSVWSTAGRFCGRTARCSRLLCSEREIITAPAHPMRLLPPPCGAAIRTVTGKVWSPNRQPQFSSAVHGMPCHSVNARCLRGCAPFQRKNGRKLPVAPRDF